MTELPDIAKSPIIFSIVNLLYFLYKSDDSGGCFAMNFQQGWCRQFGARKRWDVFGEEDCTRTSSSLCTVVQLFVVVKFDYPEKNTTREGDCHNK